MRKGIMALEGLEDLTENTKRDEVAEATAFVDAPEADMVEAEAAGAEIDQIDEASTEAEETAETLEKMGESVEASVEEGGLSEPAAEAVRVAVEHFKNRLSFPKSANARFPAMESFSKPGDARMRATKLALEDIKETAKKIWEAIKKITADAIAWLKKFWAFISDASVRLKARADKLEAAANKATATGKGHMVKGSWGKVLFGAGAKAGSSFPSTLKTYLGGVIDAMNALNHLCKDGSAGVKALLEAGKDADKFEKEQAGLISTFAKAGLGSKNSIEGMDIHEFKFALGGQSLFTHVPTTSSDLGKGSFEVNQTTGLTLKDVEEVDAILTTKGVADVANMISNHIGHYTNMNNMLKFVDDTQKAAVSAGNKAVSGEGDETIKRQKEAAAATRAYIGAAVKGARTLAKFDMAILTNALAYAGASLNAIAGTAPKEEEAAAAA